MWNDPIVAETRQLRDQIARQFNHNPDAIFDAIKLRQAQSGKETVTLPARKRVPIPDMA
ncbi:MAG: hypothetical protein RL748_992 [Pseudomonadota bacterium]|jgi:hypothetical protein